MSFGAHVRALRKASGLTLREVATRCKKDHSYISHIELGKRREFSSEFVIELAKALDEDVDVLLAMAGFISPDLREAIAERPHVFRACVRQLRKNVEKAAARQVRDGDW